MALNRMASLGPELLPWAREFTNDLNEAHFLVHQVASRLARRAVNEPVSVDDAHALMAAVARRNKIAGRTTL